MRDRKTIKVEMLEARMDWAQEEYERHAGKAVDWDCGWAQVPQGNPEALYAFGVWDGLRDLWDWRPLK